MLIATFANSAGSRSGAKTPSQGSLSNETSPTVPSSNKSRRRWSPITATPVTSWSGGIVPTGQSLGQRGDLIEGLTVARAFPVGGQLVLMLCGPFPHEA